MNEKAKEIILKELKQKLLSVEEIEKILRKHLIPDARRVSKEIAWDMAENGITNFNDQWLVELR